MGQYFCFSPRGVDAGGRAARVILREVEVMVGGLAFITRPQAVETTLHHGIF